eukprot:gnl/Dysnectes_brevis/3001_a3701_1032.p1 GENE.gnl/Dysnectes_brevis/3001_a3701_1032~~gnl/Dysnectes_brevis/3001_a3701_1032.p1  ORF type:complete len:908 (-),score=263.23 gnl/Dysnectes_brevis/3001_a3701_1032:61-2784(-)
MSRNRVKIRFHNVDALFDPPISLSLFPSLTVGKIALQLSKSPNKIALIFGGPQRLRLLHSQTLGEAGISDEFPDIYYCVSTNLPGSTSALDQFAARTIDSHELSKKGLRHFICCLRQLSTSFKLVNDEWRHKALAYLSSRFAFDPVIPLIESYWKRESGAVDLSKDHLIVPKFFFCIFRSMLGPTVTDERVFEFSGDCFSYLFSHENLSGARDLLRTTVKDLTLPENLALKEHMKEVTGAERPSCRVILLSPALTRRAASSVIGLSPVPFDELAAARRSPRFVSVSHTSFSSDSAVNRAGYMLEKDDDFVLYLRESKGSGGLSPVLWYPESGEQNCTDTQFKTFDTETTVTATVEDDGELQDMIELSEVIVVAFDLSGSMSLTAEGERVTSDTQISRFAMAREYFEALLDRMEAHRPRQVAVGLITFNSEVKTRQEPTIDLTAVRKALPSALGSSTRLYDAISSAMAAAKAYKPAADIYRRVVVISDGDDISSLLHSGSRLNGFIHNLTKSGVVYDCLSVKRSKPSTHSSINRALVRATRGYFFKPTNHQQALTFLEAETFHTLSIRFENEQDAAQPVIADKTTLLRYLEANGLQGCAGDAYPVRRLPKDLLSAKHCVTVTDILTRGEAESTASTDASSTAAPRSVSQIRRLMFELRNLKTNIEQHPYIEDIRIVKDDITLWRVALRGPESTPYAGGVFVIWVSFPPEYPSLAPVVRFVTPIYHCNISRGGKVCHPILNTEWYQSCSMFELLSHLVGLLMHPCPDDPLDSERATLFFSHRENYDRLAREVTESYAMSRGPADIALRMVRPASGDAFSGAEDVPPSMLCPLTHELFKDPVFTPDGVVFERGAILAHLRGSKVCPVTGHPLTESELMSARTVKSQADSFRDRTERNASLLGLLELEDME